MVKFTFHCSIYSPNKKENQCRDIIVKSPWFVNDQCNSHVFIHAALHVTTLLLFRIALYDWSCSSLLWHCGICIYTYIFGWFCSSLLSFLERWPGLLCRNGIGFAFLTSVCLVMLGSVLSCYCSPQAASIYHCRIMLVLLMQCTVWQTHHFNCSKVSILFSVC